MTIRELSDSKIDFDELLLMFIDLEKHHELCHIVYVQKLLELLNVNGGKCFIFEIDNLICGFSILYPDFKGGCVGKSLYVKPQYRGAGVFLKIIDYLKKYVNGNYNYCDLVATNKYISSMYEKMNFKKIYTIYRYEEK